MLERSSAELPAVPPTLLREKVIGLATHRSTPPFLFLSKRKVIRPECLPFHPPTSGGVIGLAPTIRTRPPLRTDKVSSACQGCSPWPVDWYIEIAVILTEKTAVEKRVLSLRQKNFSTQRKAENIACLRVRDTDPCEEEGRGLFPVLFFSAKPRTGSCLPVAARFGRVRSDEEHIFPFGWGSVVVIFRPTNTRTSFGPTPLTSASTPSRGRRGRTDGACCCIAASKHFQFRPVSFLRSLQRSKV